MNTLFAPPADVISNTSHPKNQYMTLENVLLPKDSVLTIGYSDDEGQSLHAVVVYEDGIRVDLLEEYFYNHLIRLSPGEDARERREVISEWLREVAELDGKPFSPPQEYTEDYFSVIEVTDLFHDWLVALKLIKPTKTGYINMGDDAYDEYFNIYES